MAFSSYIDPIENLINRYFEKRRTLSENKPQNGGESQESGSSENKTLPESPCKLIRDDKKRVYKCIYGDYAKLTEEIDSTLTIWQEEIIRNDSGTTITIETTYPDGGTSRENIVREGGSVAGVE